MSILVRSSISIEPRTCPNIDQTWSRFRANLHEHLDTTQFQEKLTRKGRRQEHAADLAHALSVRYLGIYLVFSRNLKTLIIMLFDVYSRGTQGQDITSLNNQSELRRHTWSRGEDILPVYLVLHPSHDVIHILGC